VRKAALPSELAASALAASVVAEAHGLAPVPAMRISWFEQAAPPATAVSTIARAKEAVAARWGRCSGKREADHASGTVCCTVCAACCRRLSTARADKGACVGAGGAHREAGGAARAGGGAAGCAGRRVAVCRQRPQEAGGCACVPPPSCLRQDGTCMRTAPLRPGGDMPKRVYASRLASLTAPLLLQPSCVCVAGGTGWDD